MMVDVVGLGLGSGRWVMVLHSDGSWVGSRIGVGLHDGVREMGMVLGSSCS